MRDACATVVLCSPRVRDPHSTISTLTGADDTAQPCIAVRVLAHPSGRRVGDWAPLFDARGDRTVLINRSTPEFRASDGALTGALASTRITRRSLGLTRIGDAVRLRVDAEVGAFVNGEPVEGTRHLSADELKEGVVVLFGKYLALWIGWLELHDPPAPIAGLIGESSAMRYLRRQIHRVAATDVPVLLRGETGVGKELVAAAIHDLSPRATASYVPVNAAGIPRRWPRRSSSDTSGAPSRGRSRTARATSRRPTGGRSSSTRSAMSRSTSRPFSCGRSSTASSSRSAGRRARSTYVSSRRRTRTSSRPSLDGSFREPLLRRFSFEIHVPPLRARRGDVGVLFLHLVAERLRAMGDPRTVFSPDPEADPWIPAEFVAALALHDWPGNVRELSNVTLHFVLENRERSRGRITDELRRLVQPRGAVAEAAGAPESKDAAGLADAEIVAALRAEKFSRPRAARRLGVSKSYLYKRLERLEGVRPAADIPPEEIQSALDANHGDVGAAAERLEVSTRALLLQLRRVRAS